MPQNRHRHRIDTLRHQPAALQRLLAVRLHHPMARLTDRQTIRRPIRFRPPGRSHAPRPAVVELLNPAEETQFAAALGAGQH
jgi:hypothetical protein